VLASYSVNAALYWPATDGLSLPLTRRSRSPRMFVFGAEDRRRAENSLEVVGALLGSCGVRPLFDSSTADDVGFVLVALLACARVDDDGRGYVPGHPADHVVGVVVTGDRDERYLWNGCFDLSAAIWAVICPPGWGAAAPVVAAAALPPSLWSSGAQATAQATTTAKQIADSDFTDAWLTIWSAKEPGGGWPRMD
jgi:hypothetical protein